jgi:hypothetical protein
MSTNSFYLLLLPSLFILHPLLALNVHALGGAVWGSSFGNELKEPSPPLHNHFEQIKKTISRSSKICEIQKWSPLLIRHITPWRHPFHHSLFASSSLSLPTLNFAGPKQPTDTHSWCDINNYSRTGFRKESGKTCFCCSANHFMCRANPHRQCWRIQEDLYQRPQELCLRVEKRFAVLKEGCR